MQVELKNGKKAAIVEVLSKDTFIADIGENETTWDTILIKKSEIKKVIDDHETD